MRVPMLYVQYFVYITVIIVYIVIFRDSDKPTTHHGQTCFGPVHAVQTGRAKRRNRGGHH